VPAESHAPRCLDCAYTLEGAPSPGQCPECGREFDLSDPATFTDKPPFLFWSYWLPAFLLAAIGAIASICLVVFGFLNWGPALWIGVPLSLGCLVGYGARVRWLGVAILCIGAALTFTFTLMSLSLAGAFCGISLTVILAGPLTIGALLGWVLRRTLKHTAFSQRHYLRTFCILSVGPIWAWASGPATYGEPESIRTSQVVAAPLNAAWDSVVFFEEVRGRPPLLLRIGLAHPLQTLGSAEHVGDHKTCIYNRGHITKEITQVAPGELLAFRIVEQQIGYEHDVRLLSGSFAFARVDDSHTSVTLTTTYQPRLTPRFAWRPFERLATHTLHEHVLDEMARRAKELPDADHH